MVAVVMRGMTDSGCGDEGRDWDSGCGDDRGDRDRGCGVDMGDSDGAGAEDDDGRDDEVVMLALT